MPSAQCSAYQGDLSEHSTYVLPVPYVDPSNLLVHQTQTSSSLTQLTGSVVSITTTAFSPLLRS